MLDALLIRNLPVKRPPELVRLAERRSDGTSTAEAFTLVTYETLRRESRTLSGVIASSDAVGRPGEIDVSGERRRAFVQLVSDNYFEVLGVRAFRGRLFQPVKPGTASEATAVISEDYWRRQYGRDLSALGTRFRRGNREFTCSDSARTIQSALDWPWPS